MRNSKDTNPIRTILHVLPSLSYDYGGPAYSVPALAKSLTNLGIHSRFITTDGNTNEENSLVEKIDWMKANRSGFVRKGYISPNFKRILMESIEAERPEIIHLHSIWCQPAYCAYRRSKQTGIPLVVSPRSELNQESLRKSSTLKQIANTLYARSLISTASMVHVTSQQEELEVLNYSPSARTRVVPNGISEEWLERRQSKRRAKEKLGLSREKSVLLFLSRIHPRKGLHHLLKALVESEFLETELWQVIIAGPDDDVKYAIEQKKFCRRYGIDSHITWLGRVDAAQKRLCFDAADLFVLPTAFENFGNSICEALASGIPTITTSNTPWKSEQQDGALWIIDDPEFELEGLLLKIKEIPVAQLESKEIEIKRKVLPYRWPRISKSMMSMYKDAMTPRGQGIF